VYIGGQHGAMPGATAGAAAFERFWAVLPPAASDDEGLPPPAETDDDGLPEQVRRRCVSRASMVDLRLHLDVPCTTSWSLFEQERKAIAIRRSLEHNLALQERLRGMLASMDRSQQTNADLRSQVDALRKHHKPHRSTGAQQPSRVTMHVHDTTMHRGSKLRPFQRSQNWQRFRQSGRNYICRCNSVIDLEALRRGLK